MVNSSHGTDGSIDWGVTYSAGATLRSVYGQQDVLETDRPHQPGVNGGMGLPVKLPAPRLGIS